MQGNGQFCTHPIQIENPIQLDFASTTGRVSLIASLGDLQVCIAVFHDGMYDPQVIPKHVASEMGILLDVYGHMKSTVNS